MAEHTGDPTLDRLIDEFKQLKIPMWAVNAPNPDPVLNLRKREWSAGQCGNVAHAFEKFLADHGIVFEGKLDPLPGEARFHSFGDPDYWYEDRAIRGYGSHTLTVVDSESGRFAIDWTASQYGYEEFPMVMRLGIDGWEREWSPRPELVDADPVVPAAPVYDGVSVNG